MENNRGHFPYSFIILVFTLALSYWTLLLACLYFLPIACIIDVLLMYGWFNYAYGMLTTVYNMFDMKECL